MPSKHSSRAPRTTSAGQAEGEDYTRRAHVHNQHYAKEWRLWWDALTPEERQKFIDAGITEPLQDSSRVSGHAPGEDRDAAESPLSKVEFNFKAVDATAPVPSSTPANPLSDPVVALTMQRVIGMLISAENAKVSVTALAFALNLDALNGLGSIREAARKMGLSPEALSKKKREWEKDLEIPPNAFAKSATAKIALSLAQQTKHWKNAKWTSPKKLSKS